MGTEAIQSEIANIKDVLNKVIDKMSSFDGIEGVINSLHQQMSEVQENIAQIENLRQAVQQLTEYIIESESGEEGEVEGVADIQEGLEKEQIEQAEDAGAVSAPVEELAGDVDVAQEALNKVKETVQPEPAEEGEQPPKTVEELFASVA